MVIDIFAIFLPLKKNTRIYFLVTFYPIISRLAVKSTWINPQGWWQAGRVAWAVQLVVISTTLTRSLKSPGTSQVKVTVAARYQ